MEFIKSIIFSADPEFWKSFWPSFWSTIAAGSIVGGLITWVIAKAKRANLEVTLDVATGTQGNYRLQFSILNNGKVSFGANEIYWHIYFDSALAPKEEIKCLKTILKRKPYYYYQGSLDLPCFRGSSVPCLEIPVIAKNIAILDLRYFYSLSTIHGYFPRLGFLKRMRKNKEYAPSQTSFVAMPLGEMIKKDI